MASSSANKPCVKDTSYFYSGKEFSPLGLGYTAAMEDVGTIMEGRDKNKWVVGIKNGVKVWNRIPASTPITPDLMKEKPVLGENANDDADENDEEEAELTKAVEKLSMEDSKKKASSSTKAKTTVEKTTVEKTTVEKTKTATPKKTTKNDDAASSSSGKEKRPPNDFNIYMKFRLHQLKQEQPDITHRERFSMAASEWKSMSVDEKQELITSAKEYIATLE